MYFQFAVIILSDKLFLHKADNRLSHVQWSNTTRNSAGRFPCQQDRFVGWRQRMCTIAIGNTTCDIFHLDRGQGVRWRIWRQGNLCRISVTLWHRLPDMKGDAQYYALIAVCCCSQYGITISDCINDCKVMMMMSGFVEGAINSPQTHKMLLKCPLSEIGGLRRTVEGQLG